MILDRVNVAFDGPSGCQRRFSYGWDTIFPEEEERR